MLKGASSLHSSSRFLCSRVPKQYARGTPLWWSIDHHNQYCCDLSWTNDHISSISASSTSICSEDTTMTSSTWCSWIYVLFTCQDQFSVFLRSKLPNPLRSPRYALLLVSLCSLSPTSLPVSALLGHMLS